ncbi:FIG005121: SAM-dependent methyltransferase [hydrothermal vent metagenome]|uniref:FIG005121: SAM-dependent methyltransferase n=1 Tax=hydrothermal vent metagenome TaxID=652676 RepID=A0A3B1B7T3_9ZZZZ
MLQGNQNGKVYHSQICRQLLTPFSEEGMLPVHMKKESTCVGQFGNQQHLRDWFHSTPGQALLAQEQDCIEQLLSDLFGHYLIQLGFCDSALDLSGVGRFRSHVVLDTCAKAVGASILGDAAQMPVATDCVDVVLMPHTLDFSSDPHQVLREAERVLIPEGRLILLGFNPWSLWGLWHLAHRRSGAVPWCGQFLAQRRIHDWLSLLGFDVEKSRHFMFRPPLKRHGMMGRLEAMERLGQRYWPLLSGVYVIQAVKRVSTLTLVGVDWKARARILGGQVVEPTTRQSNE